MSSHFKYEIDERNLRLRLKENEFSFNEEAWQRFEDFASAQKTSGSDAVIKKFNLSLNRNVVLPAVFGVVIILFSLLLFNFINIKNPAKESAEAAVQQPEAVVAESPVKKEPAPAENTQAVVSVKDSVPAVAEQSQPAAAAEPQKTANEKSLSEPVIKITKTTTGENRGEEKAEPAKTEQSQSLNEAVSSNASTTTTEEPVKKKRRKQRQVIVTEPTQEEAEQLPPPVEGSVQ